ncbi:MAG: biotin carboxylase N-terminal domain-containing protein [Bacteroidota bacterium]
MDSVKYISTLLIANRGEIASRIIRTCKKMGIRTVAVFSEADRFAPYVGESDQAVYIGESAPAASYLNQEKILEVAKAQGAQAIHPGYGFLAENAAFAQACAEQGIIFVGPRPEAIQAMGSKSEAKALMQAHEVPVVPGYQGEDQSPERLKEEAEKIGYPVLLKAVAGGGGKGMRIVHAPDELVAAMEAARREAQNAFGSAELILEKYIASGRHIEFQIFGDQHGNTLHLLERECTIQRRYQKVIEESPSPVMSPELRERMGLAAVKAAEALAYDNAGTVEFIYDEQADEFYFLEVNTRLQVEHPVTEEITGLDLVQLQLEVAQGMPLSLNQEDIQAKGYAIEARLYAEDPANDFLPVSGQVVRFDYAELEGLRMESAVQSGSHISVYYDPMIAKIVVWDAHRQGAHRKLHYVLENLVCQGTTTNQAFLADVVAHPAFQAGQYDTHFIDTHFPPEKRQASSAGLQQAAIAALLADWQEREAKRGLLRSIPSGWRNNYTYPQQLSFQHGSEEITLEYRYCGAFFEIGLDGLTHQVRLIDWTAPNLRMEIDGKQSAFQLTRQGNTFFVHHPQSGNLQLERKPRFPLKEKESGQGIYQAPMPSQVLKVLVEVGQEVGPGTGLMVLSSMKMENTVEATEAGRIEEIYVEAGANIEAGVQLLKLAPAEEA